MNPSDHESDGASALTGPDTSDRIVRVTRMVSATPEQIFDVLADPSQHAAIDGSGTVRSSADSAPDRLTLGSKFGMKMRLGVPYGITNEVVEFDEPQLIGWRHFGGHIWRYRLRAVEGGTLVTEEFDWRTAKSPTMLRVMRAPSRNRESIEATLDRLAARFGD